MSLIQKVQAVEEVFLHLDQEIEKFQEWSTLGCKLGCGKCCYKPDIEATILEFLPFAHYLYEHDQALTWLNKLKENQESICQIFKPSSNGGGSCSQYPYRGLICRLFGFSARTDKYGKRELVTCQIIKSEQAGAFKETQKKIQDGAPLPVMTQYAMRLHAIDPVLSLDYYPINEAIRRAVETVLHYYAYRN